MAFKITALLVGLVIMAAISATVSIFMLGGAAEFGTAVPEKYQDSFNQFDNISNTYAASQEDLEKSETNEDAQDIAIVKGTITSTKQLATSAKFAKDAATDAASILGIPGSLVLILGSLIFIGTTAALLAFLTRGSKP